MSALEGAVGAASGPLGVPYVCVSGEPGPRGKLNTPEANMCFSLLYESVHER